MDDLWAEIPPLLLPDRPPPFLLHAVVAGETLGLLGLRIFEACGSDIADLGDEHGHRVLRVRGNGGKVALVPLPPPVARAIDRAVDDRISGPILRNTHGGRMYRHAATRPLKHLAHAAGISECQGCTPHAAPHLRHHHARR